MASTGCPGVPVLLLSALSVFGLSISLPSFFWSSQKLEKKNDITTDFSTTEEAEAVMQNCSILALETKLSNQRLEKWEGTTEDRLDAKASTQEKLKQETTAKQESSAPSRSDTQSLKSCKGGN